MSKNHGGVLIMAGGTGGHIFPGLAVADALRARDASVRWLGASGGMECERVPPSGIPLHTVEISGLRGKGLLPWITAPFRLLKAVVQAMVVLREHRPICAISFGGYAAGPGGLAAWLRGIPLLVHEQNRVPGMTNKFLARIAAKVLQAFPGSFPSTSKLASRLITCGNPVRSDVVALAAPRQRMEERSGPVRILVTGGSQGASALNRTLPQALALLPENERPLVRHQTGKRDLEATRRAYGALEIEADVSAFIEDMADAYGWADLIVCRSGALTVSELAAAGLGSILVPFPFAVDDHQTKNAGFLVEAGAARLLPESKLDPESLSALLRGLITDRNVLITMAVAARNVAIPDSAERVASLCLEVAK